MAFRDRGKRHDSLERVAGTNRHEQPGRVGLPSIEIAPGHDQNANSRYRRTAVTARVTVGALRPQGEREEEQPLLAPGGAAQRYSAHNGLSAPESRIRGLAPRRHANTQRASPAN